MFWDVDAYVHGYAPVITPATDVCKGAQRPYDKCVLRSILGETETTIYVGVKELYEICMRSLS